MTGEVAAKADGAARARAARRAPVPQHDRQGRGGDHRALPRGGRPCDRPLRDLRHRLDRRHARAHRGLLRRARHSRRDPRHPFRRLRHDPQRALDLARASAGGVRLPAVRRRRHGARDRRPGVPRAPRCAGLPRAAAQRLSPTGTRGSCAATWRRATSARRTSTSSVDGPAERLDAHRVRRPCLRLQPRGEDRARPRGSWRRARGGSGRRALDVLPRADLPRRGAPRRGARLVREARRGGRLGRGGLVRDADARALVARAGRRGRLRRRLPVRLRVPADARRAARDLARYYRERGPERDGDAVGRGRARIPTREGDLLFVDEGVYRHGFLAETSIAGYYCRSADRRRAAHEAALELQLRRDVPDHVRGLARRNGMFYAPRAEALFGRVATVPLALPMRGALHGDEPVGDARRRRSRRRDPRRELPARRPGAVVAEAPRDPDAQPPGAPRARRDDPRRARDRRGRLDAAGAAGARRRFRGPAAVPLAWTAARTATVRDRNPAMRCEIALDRARRRGAHRRPRGAARARRRPPPEELDAGGRRRRPAVRLPAAIRRRCCATSRRRGGRGWRRSASRRSRSITCAAARSSCASTTDGSASRTRSRDRHVAPALPAPVRALRPRVPRRGDHRAVPLRRRADRVRGGARARRRTRRAARELRRAGRPRNDRDVRSRRPCGGRWSGAGRRRSGSAGGGEG